jgi:predicted outer membrane repeat protein
MRKQFAILITALAAALGLFSACVNPLITPMARESNLPEKALVRIETGAGAARTALPAAVFERYSYAFSLEGQAQNPSPAEPGGNEYELEPGNWEVTVKAYMGAGEETLAAEGSNSFVAVLGEITRVSVTLSPVVSYGTGTLNASLAFPADARVRSFTLVRLADVATIDLLPAAPPEGAGFSRTLTVSAGYYMAAAVMEKNGIITGKNEVTHIYHNMTTELAFDFTDYDFEASLEVVSSAADSGPGSLREAVANARDGATIMLAPPGDGLITLNSTLVINKSLSIIGGGTTLAGGGFSGSLVSITGANTNVIISRVHFKGGAAPGNGGAITTVGILTLESCVFSDNQAGGNGGAVYSTRLLTVRGSTFYGNRANNGGAIYNSTNVEFAGNLFYGNTATINPVFFTGGTANTYTFNVADADVGNARVIATLPISPANFKPLGGLGENGAQGAIASRPNDYPVADFYGDAIPDANVAAGARQTVTAPGYYLDYTSRGAGTLTVTSGSVDGDGIRGGAVTLTATAGEHGEFRGWLLNGAPPAEPPPSNVFTLNSNDHASVQAVFYAKVTETEDGVPGSLRSAIANAGGAGVILPDRGQLSLYGDLTIAESVVIEGNGTTINLGGHHIAITGTAAEVTISRVHFKDGGSAATGGAIQNAGILRIESSIFSGNRAYTTGGAIHTTGALTVLGSTFYGNAGSQGAAIYRFNGTIAIQGNRFFGNTTLSGNYNPVSGSGTVTTRGSNISDKAGGTAAAASGWVFADGDAQVTSLSFSVVSFKPFTTVTVPEIAIRPEDYPVLDFYGEEIPQQNAVIGAVQEAITPTGSGFILDYAAEGPGRVELSSGTVDGNGFASATSVTLTATAADGGSVTGVFRHWMVNGNQDAQTSPVLSLTLSENTTVRAVFSGTYTISSDADSGPGSFREAMGVSVEGDTIVLAGQTITLKDQPLSAITKSLTIVGNGATLTQTGFVPGSASQLLSISNTAVVLIKGIHFKGARTTNYGGAISNNGSGTLTLESCIFSDNQASSGAAVYSSYATLNVSGSTFYGNLNTGGAGAIESYGTTSLVGNVFWGNTPVSATVYSGSGEFNVSEDDSLGSSITYTKASALPVFPGNFKPFANSGADKAIASPPVGYPATDFYGVAIPASNAAAGAAQTLISAFMLDYEAEGPGTVTVKSGSPDGDGLYTGNVILSAVPYADKDLLHWIVNGLVQPPQTPPAELTLNMNGHKTVNAVFATAWTISNTGNDGAGSLRDVLGKASGGDRILFPQGQTITLTEPLPSIAASLVIEGNGATLTQSGFSQSLSSQLLSINSATAVVRISRLHLKGGRATNYGAAIKNTGGTLILESCVFSDNKTAPNANGGAIYSSGATASVSISGCTFVGNAVQEGGSGGVFYKDGGALTLTGNLFWGNTAASYNIVYPGSPAVVTGGFNVSDKPKGAAAAQNGWPSVTNDITATGIPLHTFSLMPLVSGEAYQRISSRPAGYPLHDFNGMAIPQSNAMAGAVQETIDSAGFVLDHGVQGIGANPGTVEVIGTPDQWGMYSGNVTLRATASDGHVFRHWTVEGAVQEDQTPPNELALHMNGHKTVRAVFATLWSVTSGGDEGSGSLRQALAGAVSGDHIRIDTPSVTLTATLSTLSKDLVIDGNGATLTRSGIPASASSSLLSISGGTVRISRLHFKGARTTAGAGGAALSVGNNMDPPTLFLESCVFSDNQAGGNGGAIGSGKATLTITGCTFVGNTANSRGGAIFLSNVTATLTGNLFWGNTANDIHSVIHQESSTVTSRGFNVSDKPGGTAGAESGWAFIETDSRASALPISLSNFRPLSNGDAYQKITTTPGGYPALDFNGTAIPGTNAMVGAVQNAIITSNYALDYGAQGPGKVTLSGTPDNNGLYSGNVSLTATPDDGGKVFLHWIVNGVVQPAQTTTLNLAMNGHKTVRGVFINLWNVSNGDDEGPGTLREALEGAGPGDRIVVQSGLTIALDWPLPEIMVDLTIEGNGATLTQTKSQMEGTYPSLLRIGVTGSVRVSRLHFTVGRVYQRGAAIYNTGKNLTLESCIFSDNRITGGRNDSTAGAIFNAFAFESTNSVTIMGCTFVENSAVGMGGSRGGAIYQNAGILTLEGNLFWGNVADENSVLYAASAVTVISRGYNVSDKPGGTTATDSGWAFDGKDVYTTKLPVSPFGDFRPLSTGAAYQAISSTSAGYPALDFNGTAIPGTNAMAGAVQDAIVSSGYGLDYGAEGPGKVTKTSGDPDAYGLYTGYVTLSAEPDSGSRFMYWTVDGTVQPDQTPLATVLTLDMVDHKVARAVFKTIWEVSNGNNDGTGSLREALTGAGADDIIRFATPQTVILSATLPNIDKNLIIEGNGSTLTQSGVSITTNSQLLRISSGAVVRISRLHFKGGRATLNAAAINNAGNLTLESCIFSDNQSTSNNTGGAIYSRNGALALYGCTFVGNTAGPGRGAAVYHSVGTLSLMGNLFWGNTSNDNSVVYLQSSTLNSVGYNVSDKPGGTSAADSGWAFAEGDVYEPFQPLDTTNFRPLSNGAAYQRIISRPPGYPLYDFDGTPIPSSNAMAGALQTVVTVNGYLLDCDTQGPGSVTVSGTSEGGGYYSGTVTLTATADPGFSFFHWTVNGIIQPDQTNVLSLDMDNHKVARAAFGMVRSVTNGNDTGDGSLREALSSAMAGDHIRFATPQTVSLSTPLPNITLNLTIEGNGSVVDSSGLSGRTPVLTVNASVEARISRLHFKDGRGLSNKGTLILESCIFSGNKGTTNMDDGGAIENDGAASSLTVLGCTFTGNGSSGGFGGAIYSQRGGTLRLTGNIFQGNTAMTGSVIYPSSSSPPVSGGYNVSDKPSGASTSASGWVFDDNDVNLTDVLFNNSFAPASTTGLPVIPTLPAGFPPTYFDGSSRGASSAPGAMPKQ